LGFGGWGREFRVEGLGFMVQVLGSCFEGFWFRVRVYGLWFMVFGLWFMVYGCPTLFDGLFSS